ncbi:GGDEF domain-containing protein [Konateibacter massiliensis]|uniref:GGDEF domain-containing protein n=1 Tax=Konateibacter massiliensis TaxID=2002841 RepID=UPI000C14A6A5|nr:sensor domain-containing diguanylate cyclase [Konateibacter massiliensis]
MNSEKIIKIHTNIARIRIAFWIVFMTLYGIGVSIDVWDIRYSPKLLPGIIVFIFIVIDGIFSIKNYYSNFRIIQIIRIPMAICALINIIVNQTNMHIASMSVLFFVLLMMQLLYLTDIARLRWKLVTFYAMAVPMLCLSVIQIVQKGEIGFTFKTLAFLGVFLSYMTFFIILASRVFAENNLVIKKLKGELIKIKQSTASEHDTKKGQGNNDYEKLSHENSEMLVENLIQQYISSSLEISNLMKLIAESLSEALVVNLCSIIVRDEYKDTYQYHTRTMFNNLKLEHFNSYIEDKRLVEVFRDLKAPFIDNEVDFDDYDFLSGMDIRSLLVYPLRNEEEWLGMLIIGKDMSDYFVKNMSFFERVSTQFSIAIMNARTYTKMENMAMKDGLTGIYNKTYMIQKINEGITDAVLNKSTLAVIFFDIDKFKKVNDTYGHMFGDEVIRVCANISKDVARKYDGFAARYGGEEFVIICKEGSVEKLRGLAETLHARVKETEISYRGSSIFVDISIGVATFPETCNNPAELIERADRAMYQSKISGRGRITFDGEYTP